MKIPTDNIDMDDPFNKVFYELMKLDFQSRVASGEIPKEDFVGAVSQFLTANIIGAYEKDETVHLGIALAYENMQHMYKQWQDQFGNITDN